MAITGVAGPDGGSDEKPVGTVDLAWPGRDGRPAADDTTLADEAAVADDDGGAVLHHHRVRFPGDRERVRWMATQLALEMLRRHLLGAPQPGERVSEAAR